MVYNTGYYNTWCKYVRDSSGMMRKSIKHANAVGLNLPPSPHNPTKELFPLYNIKGLFNTYCVQVRYHNPHLDGANGSLMDWSKKEMYRGGGGVRGGK